MWNNADILAPYLSRCSWLHLVLTCHDAADSMCNAFYMQRGWSCDAPTMVKLLRILRTYCKYCQHVDANCPQHWCESCGTHRPVYRHRREKHPYICQKCTTCESCSHGTKSIRYIYAGERMAGSIVGAPMFAMAICDRCACACSICGNPDHVLYIDDELGLRMSRCRYCKPQMQGLVALAKFSVG